MSLDEIIRLPQRKLVIARNDVELDKESRNEIFILMVEESRGSAGGRAAGSGHRRISKVYGFSCDGACKKVFETDDPQRVEQFEVPYSAVAMDITLSDGATYVVQGIVDPDFVANYKAIVGGGNA